MGSRRKTEAGPASISGVEPRAEAARFASGVVVLVTLNSPREKESSRRPGKLPSRRYPRCSA